MLCKKLIFILSVALFCPSFFLGASSTPTPASTWQCLVNKTFLGCNGTMQDAGKQLHTACVNHHLSQGIDINSVDAEGKTVLHHAVKARTEKSRKVADFIKDLVETRGAKIDAQDSEGNTPLMLAIDAFTQTKDTARIDTLLELGANPRIQDYTGKSALDYVHNNSSMKHPYQPTQDQLNALKTTFALIEAKAAAAPTPHQPLEKTLCGKCPNFKTAAARCHEGCIIAASSSQDSILYMGAKHGNPHLIELALTNGEKVDEPFTQISNLLEGHKRTALEVAVLYNKPDAVAYLLARGADANQKDKYNQEPLLYIAASNGYGAVVEHLLTADANPLDPSFPWFRALQMQGSNNTRDFSRTLELLEKASLAAKDADGRTLLHLVAAQGYEDMAKMLLSKGLNLDVRDNHGNTPLHYAALSGNHNLVEKLLKAGSTAQVVNNHGETPLHLAAQCTTHTYGRRPELVVHALTQKGLDVNARSTAGLTPLDYAIANLNTRVAEQLLSSGADTTYVDQNGLTYIDKAIAATEKAKTTAPQGSHPGIEHTSNIVVKNLIEKGAPIPQRCAQNKSVTTAIYVIDASNSCSGRPKKNWTYLASPTPTQQASSGSGSTPSSTSTTPQQNSPTQASPQSSTPQPTPTNPALVATNSAPQTSQNASAQANYTSTLPPSRSSTKNPSTSSSSGPANPSGQADTNTQPTPAKSSTGYLTAGGVSTVAGIAGLWWVYAQEYIAAEKVILAQPKALTPKERHAATTELMWKNINAKPWAEKKALAASLAALTAGLGFGIAGFLN